MVVLKDSIDIEAPCEKVYQFLTALRDTESYRAWHPEHVAMRWVKGEPFQQGSEVYFEEYLHGELHKATFVCTRAVPGRLIEYRPKFPWSLFNPRNSFEMEPAGKNGCRFTATIRLRVGPLFKKLGKKRMETVRRHMKEEGENIKNTLENKRRKR